MDFPVSFLKQSSGMDESTSARVGKSFFGGNISALPFRPDRGMSSKLTAAAVIVEGWRARSPLALRRSGPSRCAAGIE